MLGIQRYGSPAGSWLTKGRYRRTPQFLHHAGNVHPIQRKKYRERAIIYKATVQLDEGERVRAWIRRSWRSMLEDEDVPDDLFERARAPFRKKESTPLEARKREYHA